MSPASVISVEPLKMPYDAAFPMPGSKSHANRAIVAACLAKGVTTLQGATPCDDVALLVRNVQRMGFKALWIDRKNGILQITGGLPKKAGKATLDCGNAGTTLRFLTALCTITPGDWTVSGNARMRERPIGDLTKALRTLGAIIEDTNGCPPLRIRGGSLRGGTVTLDASKSSQFLSALLLIAPSLEAGLTISLSSTLASPAYIALTRRVLRDFGSSCAMRGGKYIVARSTLRSPGKMRIEGDWSAAGAYLVLAELTGSAFHASNLDTSSAQGDASLPATIKKMQRPGRCVIHCKNFPDQVMNLAVLAARRHGETILTGAANLRIKETDRLSVLTKELRKAGVKIEERPDGLRIRHSLRLRSATLDPHDDHRMAMAFAILGSMHPGIRIKDPMCVRKSYPDFFRDLQRLHRFPRCVAIVGMRGVGKTSLGTKAAKPLRMRHVDTDAVFRARHGTIQSILRRRGWAFFRRQEERIVAEHLRSGIVLSLGGGAIESASTRALLQKLSIVVWMREPTATLIQRLKRLKRPPLTDLSLQEEVPLILRCRTPLYASIAQIVLPPTLPPSKQLATLLRSLRELCSW